MKKRSATFLFILLSFLNGCYPSHYLPKDQYINIKKNDRLEIYDKKENFYKVEAVRKTNLTADKLKIFGTNDEPLVLNLNDIAELKVANFDYTGTIISVTFLSFILFTATSVIYFLSKLN